MARGLLYLLLKVRENSFGTPGIIWSGEVLGVTVRILNLHIACFPCLITDLCGMAEAFHLRSNVAGR